MKPIIRVASIGIVSLSLALLGACGREAEQQAEKLAAEAKAKVEAVDAATRTVTFKGEKGNVFEVVAGDEVKNFDQIKVGDVLTKIGDTAVTDAKSASAAVQALKVGDEVTKPRQWLREDRTHGESTNSTHE